MTDSSARAPSTFQQAVRNFAANLPKNKFGRKMASLCQRLSGGSSHTTFDVEVFGSQRAHLHPRDNISEKRVYITPQFWESEERVALAEAIATYKDKNLVFLDVGTNAGLYTLYVNSVCQLHNITLSATGVEPDPVMRARAENNFKLNGITATILPWAISDERGELYLNLNEANRGQNSIEESYADGAGTTLKVPTQKIEDIFTAAHLSHVDIMKIDIEGAEFRSFTAFFATASPEHYPTYLQIEGNINRRNGEAIQLCLAHGYQVAHETRHNSLLRFDNPSRS